MKKILFLMTFALIFAGCGNEDEELILSESNFSLYQGTTKNITASNDATWHSEDGFVAGVDENGTIIGNHVGKTNIIATSGSETARCAVEVLPRYNTYTAPLNLFGESMSTIRSKEKRRLASQTSDGLSYEGEKSYIKAVAYLFENGKLTATGVGLDYSKSDEIIEFLYERYSYLGEEDNVFYFINNTIWDADMAISLSAETQFILVTYAPYVRSQKSIPSNEELTQLKSALLKQMTK